MAAAARRSVMVVLPHPGALVQDKAINKKYLRSKPSTGHSMKADSSIYCWLGLRSYFIGDILFCFVIKTVIDRVLYYWISFNIPLSYREEPTEHVSKTVDIKLFAYICCSSIIYGFPRRNYQITGTDPFLP